MPAYRRVLVGVLSKDYPPDYQVIIYRCAKLPIQQPRIRRVTLEGLPATDMSPEEMVVLPPAPRMRRNSGIMKRLVELDRA